MTTARIHDAVDFLNPNFSRGNQFTSVINWALFYGRFLLIVTELLVIIVFIARFKLDSDIADERETFTRQQAIITSLAPTEMAFRTAQERLRLTKAFLTKQHDPGPTLLAIYGSITQGVSVSSLALDQKGVVTFSGVAPNPESFAQFYRTIATSSVLRNVNLGTVSFGRDGISFSVTAQASETAP